MKTLRGQAMRTTTTAALIGAMLLGGCTSYEAKPVAFQAPASMPAHVMIEEKTAVGARAFDDPKETTDMFGFDILQAGIMPIQVVIDNRLANALELRGDQTFLEDESGNIWPVLDNETAHQRATHYAQTKEIFKEGAYKGMLGAAAGAVVGAAVGLVSGKSTGSAAGKGAAAGAAAGAVLGGLMAATSNEANARILRDLNRKSLSAKEVEPGAFGYGLIFFPAEAKQARKLRLQLVEVGGGAKDKDKIYTLDMRLAPATEPKK